MSNNDKIKAAAVMDFADIMIGAFDSGYVNRNTCTLSEVYVCARNHVLDAYTQKYPSIKDRYGDALAKDCGLGSEEPVARTSCEWYVDPSDDVAQTGCGHEFSGIDEEDGEQFEWVKFCSFCGGKVDVVIAAGSEDI